MDFSRIGILRYPILSVHGVAVADDVGLFADDVGLFTDMFPIYLRFSYNKNNIYISLKNSINIFYIPYFLPVYCYTFIRKSP